MDRGGGRALFWVSGGSWWDIFLGEWGGWGFLGHYFG